MKTLIPQISIPSPCSPRTTLPLVYAGSPSICQRDWAPDLGTPVKEKLGESHLESKRMKWKSPSRGWEATYPFLRIPTPVFMLLPSKRLENPEEFRVPILACGGLWQDQLAMCSPVMRSAMYRHHLHAWVCGECRLPGVSRLPGISGIWGNHQTQR